MILLPLRATISWDCSIEEIAEGLDIHRNEAVKYVENLSH
jgi:hypothetical protein